MRLPSRQLNCIAGRVDLFHAYKIPPFFVAEVRECGGLCDPRIPCNATLGAGFRDTQAPLCRGVVEGEFSCRIEVEAVRLAAEPDDGFGLDFEVHVVGLVNVSGVLQSADADCVDVLDRKVGVQRLFEFECASACVVNAPDDLQ